METIMTMIIEECDEVSLELLRPLLDSVRKENKGISPTTWELGKTVFEKCATKLEPCLREAVKQLNLNVDDYAEIVASICKVTSKGQNMVSESDEIPEAYQENFTTQLNNGNGLDDNNPTESAEIVLPRNNCASSDIKPVNGAEIVQSERGTGSHRTKRCRKLNSLLRPEEGYAHIWTRGRQGSSSVSHDPNNKAKEENKVVFGKRGRSNKEKHRGKIRCGITPQKDASGDVADKIVESHLAPEKDEICLDVGLGLQTSRAAHERSRAARVKARLELTNESSSSTSLISSRARRAARLFELELLLSRPDGIFPPTVPSKFKLLATRS
ncbi:hypothetical protein PHJA_001439500 [Phtheirospermum japonicum]|uniref:Uncharacterized protein n=1 Tax=Phtheirospermum japonicum TaxID=374723 RepID=A0A830C479_9LAMI|nr:hypothetical protein PHJA_001439500 [Phtheirospermum japonicum]